MCLPLLTAMLPGICLVSVVFLRLRLNDLHLADHVIGPRGILANKARILVTNSIAFISQFDHIAFIRRGIILEQGTYPELVSNDESEISRLV